MNDRCDWRITAQIILLLLISECYTQQEWRVPDPPENVRSKTNAESVTLWWEPPASINEILVRGYTISYGIGTPSRRVIIEGAYTNAFTVNGLKPNTTYVFALTAYNEAEGEDSEKVLLTATTKLAKKSDDRLFQLQTPTNVRAKAISPNEIEVRWTDPNVDYENDNSVEAASRKRIYVIQYGIHQSEAHERLTAQVRQAVLGGLQPGTEYELAVKVVMPDGAESAWSIRELVRTPNKAPSPLWPKSFDERCHFEDSSICGFTSDDNAPLTWTRSQAGANAYLPNSVLGTAGGHYMTLQSTSSPHENYGRLISKSFKFNNGSHLCVSLWIYVKDESKGVMTIRLHKENDQRHALTVFFAQLNKIKKESWQLLLLNVGAPDVPFQLSFEVRKNGNEHFWIAIDDIDILSGRCPKEPTAVSRGTASFSDSESDVDLLVPIKSLLNERAEVYKAKGLEGFPAVGIKRGIEIVVPYRQYLPRKFFRNFAFTAVVRPADRQGGYLFAVVNPLDTVVDLGVLLESAGGSQTNITLLYTDSNKESESRALTSFLVPEFTDQWAKFALEVHDDNVVLYFRCTRFATRQVKRKPAQLVMDDAHKLYIASAGPILKGGFEGIFQEMRISDDPNDAAVACDDENWRRRRGKPRKEGSGLEEEAEAISKAVEPEPVAPSAQRPPYPQDGRKPQQLIVTGHTDSLILPFYHVDTKAYKQSPSSVHSNYLPEFNEPHGSTFRRVDAAECNICRKQVCLLRMHIIQYMRLYVMSEAKCYSPTTQRGSSEATSKIVAHPGINEHASNYLQSFLFDHQQAPD